MGSSCSDNTLSIMANPHVDCVNCWPQHGCRCADCVTRLHGRPSTERTDRTDDAAENVRKADEGESQSRDFPHYNSAGDTQHLPSAVNLPWHPATVAWNLLAEHAAGAAMLLTLATATWLSVSWVGPTQHLISQWWRRVSGGMMTRFE